MNYNYRYDSDTNANIQNGDVSSGYGSMNINNISQFNE